MNERNMLCSSNQILDFSSGQQIQSHLHPEPCVLLGNTSGFPLSNINPGLPPTGNMNNFDLHHLPEPPGGPAFYGMAQYSQPNHPATNLELGVPTASSFFNAHLNPASGARVFPVPLNNGFVDQLQSSSNYRGNAVPFSEHARGNFSTDGVRGICKRKNAEGIPTNVQHFGLSAGPSTSSAVPRSTSHFDSGNVAMDVPPALPEYRGNGALSMMEVGSGGTTRHRSGAVGLHMDSGMVHSYNYLQQGNYGGQSFQPSSCTWLEQQPINNGGAFPWSGHPMVPYFQGSNIHGGSSEIGNTSLPGYPEASSSHGSETFLHSPPMLQQHHNLHPAQNMPGVRGYGVACYPPFPTPTPSRVPTNDGMQHDVVRISQESVEPAGRSSGIRIYRSHGRSLLPDAASRRRDLPRLRTLQADRVAILEFPNFYEVDYEVDNFVDHHRDMRLDIDDMSYEELLALSERIGIVSTGLSEEDITSHLKTRLYSTSAAINLEELPCSDQNNDSCIICQDEYNDNNKLGTLECGHEYHVDCLKKWLLVKNVCPICKSSALKVARKER